MSYYNKKYEKLDLSDMQYLNNGSCAKIFCNKNIIFKEYYQKTIIDYRLNEKMFDILKNIKNPHFIELFDIYSDFNYIELLGNKIKIIPFIVHAYTAMYYPDDSVNALFEHKDYILDNFRELEILFKLFTENMICTDDIKRDNAILGKNNIVIIDPDFFYTVETSNKEYVSTLNKLKLLNLFRSILINSIVGEADLTYGKIIAYIENELVNIEVTDRTDITYEISKTLKNIKKPIELFRR